MDLNRGFDTAFVDRLQGHFFPCLLLQADLESGTIRVHSGVGDMTWDGNTWLGLSQTVDGEVLSIAKIDLPTEPEGLSQSEGVIEILSTVEGLVEVGNANNANRVLRAWTGVTDKPGGNVLLGDAQPLSRAYFTSSRMNFPSGPEIGKLFMGLRLGVPPRESRRLTHTDASQRLVDSTDTAGRMVVSQAALATSTINWPEQ